MSDLKPSLPFQHGGAATPFRNDLMRMAVLSVALAGVGVRIPPRRVLLRQPRLRLFFSSSASSCFYICDDGYSADEDDEDEADDGGEVERP